MSRSLPVDGLHFVPLKKPVDRFYGETDWHAKGLPTSDELRAEKRAIREMVEFGGRVPVRIDPLIRLDAEDET